jgi:hypothetical protein
MKGGAVAILLGMTAFVAYSLGHQNAPVVSSQPAALISPPVSPTPAVVYAPEARAPTPIPTPLPTPLPAPNISAKADLADKPLQPDSKRKVEAVLTAAAIAAIIVQASREQYHATRPCACPDDRARNGSACGGRSAYSRPGGAAPLCYPSDVTAAMIDAYRQRQSH